MPYCRQCGQPVEEDSRFCAACGSEQPGAGPAVAATETPANPPPESPPGVPPKASAPGIAIAGFVLAIVGLLVPLLGLVGVVFSGIGYARARRQGQPRGLALAGIIIGAVATVVAVVVLILTVAAFWGGQEAEQEAAVKEGVDAIQLGLESWMLDHGEFPDPSLVNQDELAGLVERWPTNPYTELPMAQGTGPGDFTYQPSSRGGYRLTGYGPDGPVITVEYP
jgi:hypothetical protein